MNKEKGINIPMPICFVCKRVVGSIIRLPRKGNETVYVARCHGQIEKASIPDEWWRFEKAELKVGYAFRE